MLPRARPSGKERDAPSAPLYLDVPGRARAARVAGRCGGFPLEPVALL